MGRSHRIPAARGIAWGIVVCAHVALLMLLSNTHTGNRQVVKAPAQEPLVLYWLEPLPPQRELRERKAPEPKVASAPRIATVPAAKAAGDTAISAPPEEKATIDWYAEAGHIADAKAREMMAGQDKSCEARKRPGSLLPKCQKDRPGGQWEPDPRRAGFSQGLPYVRLGKRCAFALIFVGCTLGKLPGPRSYAEEMRDPDRPGSSVPELEESGLEPDAQR